MTAREYEAIQEALRKKLKDRTQPTKYESGFNDGILCAMSMLHGMRQHQQNNRKDQKKA